MPDRITDVNTVGYLKRLGNSTAGILLGIIIFFSSFVVLYNNEGSVDYSEIAKTAIQIDAATTVTDPSLAEKLLVTNGSLISSETLDDGQFLKPGKYLALERTVEMYSWTEKEKTSTQNNTGGSSTSTITYDYEKKWTESPNESIRFRYPDGHANPSLPIQSKEMKVNSASIGIYSVDMKSVTLPGMSNLILNSENTDLKPVDLPPLPAAPVVVAPVVTTPVSPAQISNTTYNTPQLVNDSFIYIGRTQGSTYLAPTIGDIRISYKVLNSDTSVTLFGKLTDKVFGPYLDKNNNRFYQIFLGTKEDAVSSLHQSYVMWKWIMRVLGFVMMWTGLSMILGPIKVLTDFLPFLGAISGSLIGIITFGVALSLSGVTILIAMLFHNVVALVISIILIIAAVFFILKKRGAPVKPPVE